MKIWTLTENTACRDDLTAEHGLSLYIETGDLKILFDAGQTDAFAHNATKMGIDLGQVDLAVLSHGHYDHGGGLQKFLEINSAAPVYVNAQAFGPHYNGRTKYIGLDPALLDCSRIHMVAQDCTIADGVTLHLCKEEVWQAEPFGLTRLENGVFLPEDFRHEQYMMIQEEGKKILFSGCSHRGILNIAKHFQPDVLIGGFHYSKIDPDSPRLTDAAEMLKAAGCQFYTGHCTGVAQYETMKTILSDRLSYMATGSCIMI